MDVHAMKRERQANALLALARERGWVTLDEIMKAASGSPVDADTAEDIARDLGFELTEGGRDPWEDVETLVEEGPPAFTRRREALPTAEDLALDSPAALYLREISVTPLLTAEEEVALAKQLEAGQSAEKSLAQGSVAPDDRARLEQQVQQGEAAR